MSACKKHGGSTDTDPRTGEKIDCYDCWLKENKEKRIDVDKLLEMENRASKGPWRYDDGCSLGSHDSPPQPERKPAVIFGHINNYIEFDSFGYDPDAELIAAMRNSIRELCLEVKALRETTKTLAAAAEEGVRLLKPTCVSYGGPNPCYCYGGSPIEPPHIERECYITDKLEQALKKNKIKE